MEKQFQLEDGTEVLIRELREDDLEPSLAFFRSLAPEDRLYLRNDVTDPEVVAGRLRLMRGGRIIRLGVFAGDDIVGDGSLESEGYAWKNHIAEMRTQVRENSA